MKLMKSVAEVLTMLNVDYLDYNRSKKIVHSFFLAREICQLGDMIFTISPGFVKNAIDDITDDEAQHISNLLHLGPNNLYDIKDSVFRRYCDLCYQFNVVMKCGTAIRCKDEDGNFMDNDLILHYRDEGGWEDEKGDKLEFIPIADDADLPEEISESMKRTKISEVVLIKDVYMYPCGCMVKPIYDFSNGSSKTIIRNLVNTKHEIFAYCGDYHKEKYSKDKDGIMIVD